MELVVIVVVVVSLCSLGSAVSHSLSRALASLSFTVVWECVCARTSFWTTGKVEKLKNPNQSTENAYVVQK